MGSALGVGLIGAGVMGAAHVRTLTTAVAGVRVAAVSDAYPPRAAAAALESEDIRVHDDPPALLAAGCADPQFVVLETEGGVVVDVEVFANARYGYDIRCEVVGEGGTLALADPDGDGVTPDFRARFATAYRHELGAGAALRRAVRGPDRVGRPRGQRRRGRLPRVAGRGAPRGGPGGAAAAALRPVTGVAADDLARTDPDMPAPVSTTMPALSPSTRPRRFDRLHRQHRRQVAFAWVVVAGLFAAHVAVSLGAGPDALEELFSTWIYIALLALAAAGCLAWARRQDGREQLAWTLLAAAPALWAAGELTWLLVLEPRAEIPYPSPADALWLSAYPAATAGVAVLIRARLGAPGRIGLWLDAAIGATAVAALVAARLLTPVLDAADGSWALATDLAYPLGDLVLLALVVAAIGLTGWRPGRGWALLAAALALKAVVDAVTARQIALDVFEPGGVLAALVPWAWLLLAFAAWSPLPASVEPDLERPRTFAVPAGAMTIALALLVVDHFERINDLALVLATATIALAVARLGVGFSDSVRAARRSRREARTDALTGLANRRALVEDLDARLADETAGPGLLAVFDLDGFKRYNDRFGHPAGDVLLARLGGKLETAAGGGAYRLGGDEFCLLLDVPGSEPVVTAALGALTERGRGFKVSASHGTARLPREAADTAAAMQIADRRLYAAKEGRSASAVRQSRDVLLKVLAERQPHLHDHATDVTSLARGVAQRLLLSAEEEDIVVRAAELHDIGKMAVPDAILNKPGPLDGAEWSFMRRHTVIGEEILSVAPALRSVAALVRSHHERWDGTGYPDGVEGDAIPLGARIVAVCDAFSAMCQDRAYQRARSADEALAEIERGAGTHFDPRVVDAFCEELTLSGARGA